MKRCHHCGTEWHSEIMKQPGVKEICPDCSYYLHCCLNCRFYEPGAHNECHIPTTDYVGDNEGCNFCDEFEFADADEVRDDGETQAARDVLEKLFGAVEHKTDKDRLDDFNRLFGE